MVGISHYGAYLPRLRLDRGLIAAAWGKRQATGSVAVASYDEDALTLAIEAAGACATEPESIDGVHFASTSGPYAEKQHASIVATALDLRREIFSADYAGSTRCGVSALLAALRSVQAGAARRVLVTVAEQRLAAPESELEGMLGDGAAAFVVGEDGVIAELVDAGSVTEEFTYHWRTDRQSTVQVSGGRFANTYGYERDMKPAIEAILQRQSLEPRQIGKLALYSPDPRAANGLAVSLGFDEEQLVEPLFSAVGCTGAAEAPLLLARALDGASPGDLILCGGFGEGADVLLFRATEAIEERRAGVPLQSWLDSGEPLSSYEKVLKYRRLIDVDEPTDVVTSVLEHQELEQNVRLHGSRCRECGQVQYPKARVCVACRQRECLDDVPVGRSGVVFTFTVDHLIANLEHPLPMVVVDVDGGARLYLQIADAEEIAIGAPVVLTFRRMHEGGGNRNYYWKARCERVEGER